MSETPKIGEFWIVNLGGDHVVGRCTGEREWQFCGDEQWFEECDLPHAICKPVRKVEIPEKIR